MVRESPQLQGLTRLESGKAGPASTARSMQSQLIRFGKETQHVRESEPGETERPQNPRGSR